MGETMQQLTKKHEIRAETVDISKLPEEYLRIEFPEDWKYRKRINALMDGTYFYQG
ncbi:hypothetical protein HS7_12200 [Sulfolobales archaeon HS-7]|nr:hypothetical protein HS7_12200 [Sulfolobales archaeon HS-7]